MSRIDVAADNPVRENVGSGIEALESLASQPQEMPETQVEDSGEETVNMPTGDEPGSVEDGEQSEGELNTSSEDGNLPTEDVDNASVQKMKYKAFGEEQEIDLSPDNDKLKELLEFGALGKKSMTAAQKYKRELEDYKSKYSEDIINKAATIDEITSLVERGYAEQAVKALLGDKYDDFKSSEIVSTIDYENASPDERAEIDRQRAQKEKEWVEYQKNKKIEELEKRLNDREEAVEFDRWHGLGERLLHKYSMSNYTDDSVRAEKINELMWKNVWNEMPDDEKDWTPRKLEKAFRETSSLLRGNLKKTSKDHINKTIEAKKNQAKEEAQMVARRNYSSNSEDKNEFNQKIRNTKSALDRLGLLAGRN